MVHLSQRNARDVKVPLKFGLKTSQSAQRIGIQYGHNLLLTALPGR